MIDCTLVITQSEFRVKSVMLFGVAYALHLGYRGPLFRVSDIAACTLREQISLPSNVYRSVLNFVSAFYESSLS